MKDFVKDIVDQAWTLLGMWIAWVVLEGSAKTVAGYVILGTCGFWLATYPLRREK